MANGFIIPIYNHHETIAATVTSLLPYQLPVIIVDDGSDHLTKAVLAKLPALSDLIHLITLPQNGGKGAAVSAGIRYAAGYGLSHVLQIDADGQHNMDDIPEFWQLSALYPSALISGQPIYDNSMPLGRRLGRQITHFWVHIETLSLAIKDSMLGLRIYPVAPTVALLDSVRLGQRMDFDIEIMVRLYWQQVPVKFIPTRVIYPRGGRSHFKMLRDNWLITKMHTRLFFGMLKRAPELLCRKWSHN